MTLQKANEKRIENFLAKQIRHNGKILSMREFMDSLIADGYSPRAKAEQKVVHPSSRQTFRWNNEQQREHQIKRALGGTVLKYSMVSSDGSFYDIEKIAYDYVIEKMGGVNVKPETMCFAIFNSPSSLRGGKRERCVAVYSRTVATEEQRVRSMLSTDFTHYDLVWFGEATSQKEALELAEG
ncbi:TPA: hypothetical protein ACPY6C_004503 [Enterobacter hormaechei subsp. steigerwaltii]|uniref:hypothetical protein n=1 Tax=Citrobacter rodentium TaxID=67825 RepID=UPI003D467AC0